MFPFSDPVITDNPKKMAWHSRKPEEEKQLLESLTKENRIGCLIEKKPDGKTYSISGTYNTCRRNTKHLLLL
jgi:hypothetical protein